MILRPARAATKFTPQRQTYSETFGENSDTFELTPHDMKWWLKQEKRLVRLMSERRLQEAANLVKSYEAGSLTAEEVHRKWSEYHSHWPCRLCLDRRLEEEIECEATGFEKDPTDESVYRPRHRRAR